MNFKELMEGTEPKLPGAFKGVQVMTPQQFVAKAGDMPGEESEEGVAEGSDNLNYIGNCTDDDVIEHIFGDATGFAQAVEEYGDEFVLDDLVVKYDPETDVHSFYYKKQGVAEGSDNQLTVPINHIGWHDSAALKHHITLKKTGQTKNGHTATGHKTDLQRYLTHHYASANYAKDKHPEVFNEQGVAEAATPASVSKVLRLIQRHRNDWFDNYGMGEVEDTVVDMAEMGQFQGMSAEDALALVGQELESLYGQQGVAEGEEHLARIRKLSGLEEATKLPAQTRDLGGQEFQDYMTRIVGTPDVDKQGNVKVDKKGNEKYVSGKTKSDKYKMPYIHRSSVIEYVGPDGKTYDEDKIKQTLAIRPKALLKQNEKMKHSNGEFEQFFNVGFAALTGIALDEQTNNLIIVNTCPGAGSCKVDCFAMKGGKVQFKNAWQSDGRILTYLLNDPDGFFNQLSAEITKESNAGKKGDKKFPNGWQTTVRWHDAGDFFSPEYLDLALKMAAKHPDVKFYAYTKMAGAALAKKPDNFIINWSEGAHTSQEKQVKASDANLDTTKNSRIVPDELFQDLLVKDEKKNLVKGAQGQWQVQPDKLPELKQRLAKQYGLSANSILSYDEYMAKRKSIPQGMKYNVIVAPGEGDISANDQNIISTLLLRH